MNIFDILDRVKLGDNFFDYIEVAEKKQVKMVAYMLKGENMLGGIESKLLGGDLRS